MEATNEQDQLALDRERLSFDRERWSAEANWREREITRTERERSRKSGWRNPLVVAILAATVAAAGSAAVAVINGVLQRNIERQKAEHSRILAMISSSDPDKVAENLDFLLKAHLVEDEELRYWLRLYLDARTPGTGPTNTFQSSTETSRGERMRIKVLPEPGNLRLAVTFGGAVFGSFVVDKRDSSTPAGRWIRLATGNNQDNAEDEIDLGDSQALVGSTFVARLVMTTVGAEGNYDARIELFQGGKALPNGQLVYSGGTMKNIFPLNITIEIGSPE